MTEETLLRAKALLGGASPRPALGEEAKRALPGRAGDLLTAAKKGLDVYLVFDTTGSMSDYIDAVRRDIVDVSGNVLNHGNDIRLSINGVGDHCDGENCLQMYALSNQPEEIYGTIESIIGTHGGDEPEAYECLALALAQRIPTESTNRKRAVILVGDSVPHGMIDGPCEQGVDYQAAFSALKTLCDGFYFVGCNAQMYGHQRKLVDERNGRERFIPLGEMTSLLPNLIIALAKKADSEKSFESYLQLLSGRTPELAQQIRGILPR